MNYTHGSYHRPGDAPQTPTALDTPAIPTTPSAGNTRHQLTATWDELSLSCQQGT